MIVLSIEDKLNYLEQPIPPAPVVPAGQHVAPEILAAHTAWIKGSKEIDGLMLMTMKPDIQQNLETLHAHEMLLELKTLFAQQAEQELLHTTQDFHSCKQEKRQSVSSYVQKIKGYIDNLERLGNPVTLGLGVSLILISLRKEFDGFVQNYNMHSLGKTINELHAMLKLHEQTLPKNNDPALHAIRVGKVQKVNKHKKSKPQMAARGQNHGTLEEELSSVLSRVAEEEKERSFGSWWFSKKLIEKLEHDGLLNSTDLRDFKKRVSCMSGEMARKPYTHQVEKAKDLLRLIHTDHKHEVFETFKVFQKKVENQLGKTIKSLRSDRGGEYMSQEFLDHLKDHGIIAHRTPPYTPQYNGVSKRRNRTLLDMVRSMMSQTTLLKSSWDYALETAARILNMVPTKKVEKTPYERDTLTKLDKLEPKSIKCIFIRYPKETMGYSFYYPPENKVLDARNAEFLENSLITQEASGSLEDLEIIQEEDTHPSIDTSLNHKEDDLEIDEPQSDIVLIRRSTRTRQAPDRMGLYIDAEEHELGDLGEPANYKAALLDLDKWLFKKKTNMDGVVHTYKARHVAKGYTLTSGIDYEETFSPVADIRAIRILIAIVAYYDYEIWQINVKTSFLNRYLNEDVYMEQPEERYYMENSKHGSIPMQEKLELSKSQGASTPAELKRMQNVPYSSAVGSIMYAVRCTRPDVAFAQNVTSRFPHNPGDLHRTTVKNIMKYLMNTKGMFLVYGGDLKRELRISCYNDAGYLTGADDLKSQTGYV
nr:retrotransposon protein, putative, Ty1-copia subclass [Tanacetum cinerariifolium]